MSQRRYRPARALVGMSALVLTVCLLAGDAFSVGIVPIQSTGTAPAAQTTTVPYPRFKPFQLLIGEVTGDSGATAFVFAAERGGQMSFVGRNGNASKRFGTASVLVANNQVVNLKLGIDVRTFGVAGFLKIVNTSGEDARWSILQ